MRVTVEGLFPRQHLLLLTNFSSIANKETLRSKPISAQTPKNSLTSLATTGILLLLLSRTTAWAFPKPFKPSGIKAWRPVT